MAYIYNSRNYRSLLALTQSARFSIPISTIVEIIEAYQPCISVNLRDKIYNSRNYRSLLALVYKNISFVYIYNSRNYRSLLAKDSKNTAGNYLQQQKLQKLTSQQKAKQFSILSTIVEIIEAYQPKSYEAWYKTNLQQQKLQKLTSHLTFSGTLPLKSTIVEIIEAYQPLTSAKGSFSIYNSRNYRSLLALQL